LANTPFSFWDYFRSLWILANPSRFLHGGGNHLKGYLGYKRGRDQRDVLIWKFSNGGRPKECGIYLGRIFTGVNSGKRTGIHYREKCLGKHM